VRYAQGKRTFLNELREAFEKNPNLRSECRERIDYSMNLVFTRAQSAAWSAQTSTAPTSCS